MSLKFHVQRVRAELELKQSDFWKNKFMLCKDDYPNLLILVKLCHVIPWQTACCEQGNSCMNRIMTDWRSSLNVSTIDELMRIVLSVDLLMRTIVQFLQLSAGWRSQNGADDLH